ncbi:MAG: substrate-binding domain-containing protein [Verrucomicrobiae bacterium]|nr:substrate-binding domain-containing protein [Verrucomicrobiae bacterium]
MKAIVTIICVLAIGLIAISFLHHEGGSVSGGDVKTLTVYCAAGIKNPVAAAAAAYEQETGVRVQLQFGGTGTLLSQIRVANQGDLFVAADEGAVADAKRHKTVREVIPLVLQYPVIAVKAGNPKKIASLADLLREDVKTAIANPEAASIGKATRAAAGDRWPELKQRVAVMKPTVTELAADLTIGAIDAAVIWNSTVPQFKGIEAVRIPEFDDRSDKVTVSVLSVAEDGPGALKFARYLAAPEKGGEIFRGMGFEAIQGDRWAEAPELILYSGGVNRPAVEELLKEFQAREGITIHTMFNGCGILCAAMKAMTNAANPKYPDAYYACDLCFVPPVAEQFPEAVLITETDIGICVQKGNPLGIKTLADLAQPKLRVGLCNAEQSTLGYMTKGMLTASALFEAIRKNVVVEVPTADFLVNQMRAGALDAAIVYRVNFQLQEEHLDYVAIDHEGAKAVQPFAVRGDSERKQLAGRLLEHMLANRGRFEASGFTWKGDLPTLKSKDIVVPDWLKPEGK